LIGLSLLSSGISFFILAAVLSKFSSSTFLSHSKAFLFSGVNDPSSSSSKFSNFE
jgi:hypothetical protein